MTDFRDDFDLADDRDDPAADALLARATDRLRSMPTPPLPGNLFAGTPDVADVAPVLPGRSDASGHASRSWRFVIAFSTTIAAIVVVAAGIGVAVDPFGLFGRRDPIVENDPSGPPPSVEVATAVAVAPHPDLSTLSERTADLQARVHALRLRAEATAARRQADRLLEQYARR